MKITNYVSIMLGALVYSTASAETIFSDDFNNGLGQWSTSGAVTTDENVVIDGLSAYLQESATISKDIDVSSHDNVVVSYSIAARLLEDPDFCIAE